MTLREFLSTHPIIILDGGMGTELARAGLEMGGQNNLPHPDAVRAVHKAYVDSGVNLLITNTLTMNRVYLESHKLDVDVRDVNLRGVQLAKSAAREGMYILGDISSTGKMLEPHGDLAEALAFTAFEEQAAILAEGGVDGFIVETMFDLNEALCALRACKTIGDLPVFVSIAFKTPKRGGRTMMGNSASDCATALTDAGASAIGANCGDLTPSEIAEVLAVMREVTSLPLLAQPNAGKPKLIEGKTVFDMTPADFAAGMVDCVAAGARLVGGCCGTTSAHIRALVQVLSHKRNTLIHGPLP